VEALVQELVVQELVVQELGVQEQVEEVVAVVVEDSRQ